MNVTEVNIKLVRSPNSRLRAFCSLTINDELVVRDVKIIEGNKGPFVAMPSRKLQDRCPRCSGKNHLRASFCGECGHQLKPDRAPRDDKGRPRLHVDVCHPINSEARASLQDQVISAYEDEVHRSEQPGYQFIDIDDDNFDNDDDDSHSNSKSKDESHGGANQDEETPSRKSSFSEGIL